jgi:hypothetical protein
MTTPSKASGENHLTPVPVPCTGHDTIGRFLCAKCGDRIPPGPLASLGEGWLCDGCMAKSRPGFTGQVVVGAPSRAKAEPEHPTDPIIYALSAAGIAHRSVYFDSVDCCWEVTTRTGITRKVRARDIERLGLDLAVRDEFLCSICSGPMPTDALGKMRTGAGRSACGCTLREVEPAFDTDIRVGDVVEVVSSRNSVRAAVVGYRGVARRVARSNAYEGADFVAFDEPLLTSCHGRFRVIEREGKAYERPEDKALGVLLDATDRVDAVEKARRDEIPCPDESGRGRCDGCEVRGETRDTLAVSHRDPICNWCSKPITNTDPGAAPWPDVVHLHGECLPYWSALEKRVKGGAYDIPEERESVRRFVDGHRDKASCPPPSDDGGALPYQPIDERIREARLSGEVDPVSGWTAWATAGDES